MTLARRVVVAFAVVWLVGWALAVVGVTRLPSTPFIVVDLVFDVVVLIGLWTLYRPAWGITLALTILGELTLALHPVRHAVILLVGLIQAGLLLHPALRRGLRERRIERNARRSPSATT
jgi:hypothetical protein